MYKMYNYNVLHSVTLNIKASLSHTPTHMMTFIPVNCWRSCMPTPMKTLCKRTSNVHYHNSTVTVYHCIHIHEPWLRGGWCLPWILTLLAVFIYPYLHVPFNHLPPEQSSPRPPPRPSPAHFTLLHRRLDLLQFFFHILGRCMTQLLQNMRCLLITMLLH